MIDSVRRKVLIGTVAGVAIAGTGAALFLNKAPKRNPNRVVISGWGGSMQRAMREAYFAPFTRDTGIEVVEQTYGSQGLARVNAQLREGNVQVDLLDGAPFWPVVGQQQGLLDRFTLPGIDSSHFLPGALAEYAFGYSTVSWGITYSKQLNRSMESWSDFWDTAAFPGRRTLFGPFVARHPEYALMADGVPLTEVYPLKQPRIDRAFTKLAELVPAIDVFYQTATQCEQLLVGDQVDMAEFFNGRVFVLQDQGVPLEYVWNQALMNMTVFVLAKDAPNRENALTFLAWLAQPEPQAALAALMYYGPTNKLAMDLIESEQTLRRLPTYGPNLARQLILDANWWGENLDQLAPRWNQLISG
jgi:putative spermidine/putrescine transport system substrate-binding protein